MTGFRTGLGRPQGITLGLVCYGAGAFLIWEAFEGRGKARPFTWRLVSGLV